MQPFPTVQAHHEDEPPGAQFGGHGQPHTNEAQAAHQGQRQGDAHAPHGGQVDEEGPLGIPRAAQGARGHNGRAKQRLSKGHNPQHLAAQVDDLRVGGENLNQLGREEEQNGAAKGHDDYAHPADRAGEPLGQILAARANGLAHQGGARHRHARGRQVADGLRRNGQVVGRHRHRANAGNQGGDDNLGQADDGALQGGGQAQLPGGQQALAVEAVALLQVDLHRGLLAEHHHQEQAGHNGRGKPRGKGGAAHAPAKAPHIHLAAEQIHGAGGVDEQGVQDDVKDVNHQIQHHGRAGIPRAADDGAEHIGAQRKGHGAGHDAEIQGGVPTDGGVGPQHGRQEKAEHKGDGAHQHPKDAHKAQRLPGDALGVLLAAGAQVLGHLHGKADGRRVEEPVEQPGGAGGDAHRRCGIGAQRAHHGSVHVLHQGEHNLLDDGGPGQEQHRGQCGAEMGRPRGGQHGGNAFVALHSW